MFEWGVLGVCLLQLHYESVCVCVFGYFNYNMCCVYWLINISILYVLRYILVFFCGFCYVCLSALNNIIYISLQYTEYIIGEL